MSQNVCLGTHTEFSILHSYKNCQVLSKTDYNAIYVPNGKDNP